MVSELLDKNISHFINTFISDCWLWIRSRNAWLSNSRHYEPDNEYLQANRDMDERGYDLSEKRATVPWEQVDTTLRVSLLCISWWWQWNEIGQSSLSISPGAFGTTSELGIRWSICHMIVRRPNRRGVNGEPILALLGRSIALKTLCALLMSDCRSLWLSQSLLVFYSRSGSH